MKINSQAFEHNGRIPAKYTCNGENINPPLEIVDVPENAKSMVLIVDDPDAPMGNWSHWVVFNIDPRVKNIAENSVPEGAVEGNTTFGKPGYGGPCPPSGTHRYFFKLYALKKTLAINGVGNKEILLKAMEGAIVDQAELIGLYSQK